MQDHSSSKANGYNRNLYRNPRRGPLAGVVTGLAEYFEIPVWVARLIAISLFIFVTTLFVIAYVAGIFLLAKRPVSRHRYQDEQHYDKNPFSYQKPAGERLRDIHERLQALDKKTSPWKATSLQSATSSTKK